MQTSCNRLYSYSIFKSIQAKTAYVTFSDAVIPVTAQHLQDSQTHDMLIAREGVTGNLRTDRIGEPASTLIQSFLTDHRQV